MSIPNTPKKAARRRSTTSTPKRLSSKTPTKSNQEEGKGTDDKAKKTAESWSKTDEVLSHLTLVGLGDGVPSKIQQLVRQKIVASRRALQKRAGPLEITKPLLDLSELINDHGVRTGKVMNQHLDEIRTVMEEATMEKFEDRATETSKSTRAKDVRGLEMKKKLYQAKTVLNQLSDLNELKITIRNSVELILKTNGFVLEEQARTNSRAGNDVEKLGVKDQDGSETTNRNANWKKIEGVLDHLMRVCQRPNIAGDLQQIMLSKIAASRRFLQLRADPLKISKPLHELIDILNDHGLESCDVAKIHLREMQNLSECKLDNAENSSFQAHDLNGVELRKMLGQARSYMNYLSQVNELKMIIKNSADLIQRGGTYTMEELQSMLTSLEEEEKLDVSAVVREADQATLSPTLKTMVKVNLARVGSILGAPGGQEAMKAPLQLLSKALKSKTSEDVAVACNGVMAAVSEYKAYGKRLQIRK